jgi:hypothetical protein
MQGDAAISSLGVLAAAAGWCFKAGFPIDHIMAAAFLVFWLGALLLLVILWVDHRDRTGAGKFKGIILDAHQRAFLKTYFSVGPGRIHGLILIGCVAVYLVTMTIAMTVYDIRWESCQAVRMRSLQSQ